ncbi:MAG: hypothetical protein Kow0069_17270 [Promethearchaeota archaeon]
MPKWAFDRRVWSVVTIGGFLFCVVGAAVLTFGVAGAKRYDVSFHAAGDLIDATIWVPEAGENGTKPALVLVHGHTASKEYMQGFAIEFAKRGFVSLTLSMPGHGQSTGTFRGSEKSPAAVKEAVDYLVDNAGRFGVNSSKIALIGHSFGAVTVIKAGAADARVNATVAVAAPSFNSSHWLSRMDFDEVERELGFHVDDTSLPAVVNATSPKNLFFVVGRLDEFVTAEDARLVVGAAAGLGPGQVEAGRVYWSAGTRRKFQVYSLSDHWLECSDPRVLADAIRWVEESLGAQSDAPVRLTEPYRFPLMMLALLLGLASALPVTSCVAGVVLPGRRDLDGARVKAELKAASKASGMAAGAGDAKATRVELLAFSAVVVVVGGLVGGALTFLRSTRPWLQAMGYQPYFTMLGWLAVPTLLGTSVVLAGAWFALYFGYWKRRGIPLGREDWLRKRDLPWEFLTGAVVSAYLVVVVCLSTSWFWINLAPITPRTAPFFAGLLVLLPVGLVDALLFKAYLLNRLQHRWTFWKAAVVGSLATSLVKGATFGVGFATHVTTFPFGSWFLAAGAFGGIWFLLSLLLDVFATWTFFRTRSPLAAAIVTTAVYAFVFTQITPFV